MFFKWQKSRKKGHNNKLFCIKEVREYRHKDRKFVSDINWGIGHKDRKFVMAEVREYGHIDSKNCVSDISHRIRTQGQEVC